MLIKLELFIEKSRFSTEDGSGSKFVFSWLTAIIDKNGDVKIVRPTDADRRAIGMLPEHDQGDLNARFSALAKARAQCP
jgi:hypothetical protein